MGHNVVTCASSPSLSPSFARAPGCNASVFACRGRGVADVVSKKRRPPTLRSSALRTSSSAKKHPSHPEARLAQDDGAAFISAVAAPKVPATAWNLTGFAGSNQPVPGLLASFFHRRPGVWFWKAHALPTTTKVHQCCTDEHAALCAIQRVELRLGIFCLT